MTRKKKKKTKGFKLWEFFVCHNLDNKAFLLSLSSHNSLEKYAKTAHNSLEKYAEKDSEGEYCPKISGCCWDYKKEVAHAV